MGLFVPAGAICTDFLVLGLVFFLEGVDFTTCVVDLDYFPSGRELDILRVLWGKQPRTVREVHLALLLIVIFLLPLSILAHW
jgi:hypothetical protein